MVAIGSPNALTGFLAGTVLAATGSNDEVLDTLAEFGRPFLDLLDLAWVAGVEVLEEAKMCVEAHEKAVRFGIHVGTPIDHQVLMRPALPH